ncbi:DHHC palmitoyltransferase-domain-containing protein [Mycena olivaceomarginata]|nr:DHHC palmitoyltransferase-domain-containing protein [Mycena olivaceomarginata]
MPNAPPAMDKVVLDKPTFCGTITEARVSARERRERKPQPWAVRKLMVLVTLGIMGYTAYVYAGRFAVRLMNGGRRPEGIGLLVGWSILYAWMLWAYIKVILTPPGNARDYVSQSPQPLLPPQQWAPHDAYRNGNGTNSFEFDSGNASFDSSLADIETGRIGGPAYAELLAPLPPAAHGSAPNSNAPHAPNGVSPPNGELPPPATARRPSAGRRHSSRSRRREGGGGGGGRPRGRLPPPAPLLPAHRYCARCSIVKPYRAHHCRVCGTCILKFDHHCPWIGQCVGARNHKFFLAFAYATAIFTIYTFGSLLAFNVRGGSGVGETDVDPQEVVIIALAALFALFTLTLGAEHTRLILLSQTTVRASFPFACRLESELTGCCSPFSFFPRYCIARPSPSIRTLATRRESLSPSTPDPCDSQIEYNLDHRATPQVESLGIKRVKERDSAGLEAAGLGCWQVRVGVGVGGDLHCVGIGTGVGVGRDWVGADASTVPHASPLPLDLGASACLPVPSPPPALLAFVSPYRAWPHFALRLLVSPASSCTPTLVLVPVPVPSLLPLYSLFPPYILRLRLRLASASSLPTSYPFAKRRALASYDAEWGAPDTEGNVWWAGSARAGWEDAMGRGGRGGLGWVFPIGAPLGDGLHYVPNPRFTPDGRPRRRAEWPEELR